MKIDLHTHSEASKDGGITPEQYARVLQDELLDCIAITDHDRIDFAQGMQKALGSENIIVGQEITTNDGEIIGLFLKEAIKPHMSAQDTIDEIKKQKGLVYIPHPFETVRKGLKADLLTALRDDIDIIETHNGRAVFQNFTKEAVEWTNRNGCVAAGSSDAHGTAGLGKTYTFIDELPTRDNLVALLKSGHVVANHPPLWTLALPKFNRLKNFIKGRG